MLQFYKVDKRNSLNLDENCLLYFLGTLFKGEFDVNISIIWYLGNSSIGFLNF
jgi:hypothetical protein